MKFSEQVENKFFEILRIYNINLQANNLMNLNVNQFYREIILLKSKKTLHNTEFELLNRLKSEILEIQKYNDSNSYIKLNEYLKYIDSYNSKISDNHNNDFENIIKYISSSSKESIVNSSQFNHFNEYMHVQRPIEYKLKTALKTLKTKHHGIILLVGSVGDGKSHLLSYFNKNNNELLNDVYIYNDATESDNPYKTAVETLTEKLENYEKGQLKKLIIAINIGMLHNFKEYLIKKDIKSEIIQTIEASNIFSTKGMENTLFESKNITLVSFLNESNFQIKNQKVVSEFYNEVFKKIFQEDMSNPFYKSFIADDGKNRNETIYQNFQLLSDKKVQSSIIHLLIKIQIENKRIISTRALLNFIHDIIVPDSNVKSNDSFLVNLLFNSLDKSSILSDIYQQDPAFVQDAKLDQLNIEIYNSLALQNKCEVLFGKEDFVKIKNYLYLLEGLSHKRKFEMIIRLHYLFNYEFYEFQSFFDYINMIENIETNKQLQKTILKKIYTAIYKWKGSPLDGFIYNESLKPDTSMRIGLQFDPKAKNIKITNKVTILVTFEIQEKFYDIEIDYNLFILMEKIENGYILKEKDKIEAVVFSEFVDNILNNIKSNDKTIINIPSTNETYMVSEGFLGYEIEGVK
ncbi:DNA phosphorothioation-dependent restriction protein DptF [Staphylococcus shinii]|uniref:DNA phosphorothioation-dependent restriction protein DptF n=1 Tax=Staphylococcus shinii TaxID=2912228 RepID=UPI00057C23CC|nr:DNA phosphorothioation-dependent restriction protein DptF [Staphylococcus shinii]